MVPDVEVINLMTCIAELAVEKYATKHGDLRPYLSVREAGRMYGPAVIKRWHKEGLITFIKDGNNTASIRIDRIQLEAVAKSSNRGL